MLADRHVSGLNTLAQVNGLQIRHPSRSRYQAFPFLAHISTFDTIWKFDLDAFAVEK